MRCDTLIRSDDRGTLKRTQQKTPSEGTRHRCAGKLQTASRAVRHPGASRDHPEAPSDKGQDRVATAQEEQESQRRGPQSGTEVIMEFSHCQDSH